MKVNEEDYGFTNIMGPKLRDYVKLSLYEDLLHYFKDNKKVKFSECVFDWSETYIEGHRASYLDGEIENFSGISILDKFNNIIASGWMKFIEESEDLHIFWMFLNGGNGYNIHSKSSTNIPAHVWNLLNSETQEL